MSNEKNIVKKSSSKESPTLFWMPPPSLGTSESLSQRGTPNHIRDWLMSLRLDSHVSPSQSPGKDSESMTQETCGQPPLSVFASFDRDTHSWRTSQACLFTTTLNKYSEIWPKAGTIVNGVAYLRPKWEQTTKEIDSGSVYLGNPRATEAIRSEKFKKGRLPSPEEFVKMWPTPCASETKQNQNPRTPGTRGTQTGLSLAVKLWPTPTVHGNYQNKDGMIGLATAIKMWPTPRKFMHKDATIDRGKGNLGEVVGGQLNPMWVEWLMGWPLGWTDLKPLAMGKYRKWLEQHGNY